MKQGVTKLSSPLDVHIPDTFIREWRRKKGFTLKEVAERMNTTQATLSRVETGGALLTWPLANSIAHAMEISVFDLLFRHPEETDAAKLFSRLQKLPRAQRDRITHILSEMISYELAHVET